MSDENLSPARRLLQLATGYWTSQAVYVAAELGLADALPDDPGSATAEELAAKAGAHPRATYRLLRVLADAGVCVEDEQGRFHATELGRCLRSGEPGSLRDYVRMSGRAPHYAAWGALLHGVRTGERAFDHVFGQRIFDYFAGHPEDAAVFDAAMAANTAVVARAVAEGFDFSRFAKVVDVGGGVGALLAEIVAAHPETRGVVADLAHVLERARPFLGARGLLDRIELMPADFFASVPAGGDAYLLKSILHDWEDEKATAILASVRRAIGPHGTLLLVELVVPPPGSGPSPAHALDLNMMVMTGGCERGEPEWRALLAAGGFRLERIHALAAPSSLIEARPA